MFRKRQEPGPDQESVWDYPRPPRVEKANRHVKVVFNDKVIAESDDAYRLLETSHPPTYYIPKKDVNMEHLTSTPRRSFCEFKGAANYWSIQVDGKQSKNAAWGYANPSAGYEVLADHVAFYASRVDEAWVGSERVKAQEGDFYGGWITSDVVGPFKGGLGTFGW